jgi:hypothetical protein
MPINLSSMIALRFSGMLSSIDFMALKSSSDGLIGFGLSLKP